MNWFKVDKEGLAAILKRRGIEFALFELVSNALDTRAKNVTVTLESMPGKPLAKVVVTDDDPDGFKDLSHAFTLFAPSEKKGAADKRGRFNLGEKLVLAICEHAKVSSTTGEVVFDNLGRHEYPRRKRAQGSEFSGLLRMTRAEVAEALKALDQLLVPPDVVLTINGTPAASPRKTVAFIESLSLPTEIADAEGNLVRAQRMTCVQVLEPRPGEVPMLYELGVPVVETGDRWHVNVLQKVPLNLDRDNVPPVFLRKVRAYVLNALADQLKPEEAAEKWVREAAGAPEAEPHAVERTMALRFGDKRVVYDPSDPEANKIAVAAGFTVVHGGSLSSGEWDNVRRAGAILPAGQVTPSPKPFHPDGEPLTMLPSEKWSVGMRKVTAYASALARRLLAMPDLRVRIADDPDWPCNAAWQDAQRVLTINRAALGDAFFDLPSEAVDRLLLHEFAHHFCGDHLDREFAEAGFRLGATLKCLAMNDPGFFREFEGGA